jgi:pimeloyl-ACP methyl ester carboxylesterase
MRFEVDGRTAYAYTGAKPLAPERPTIALIHGAAHDHSVWALQSRYLAHHGWNVLAFDLPGHGRSDGPPLPTVEQMGEWVVRTIAAAIPERSSPLVIAGHSMGSLIALEAASAAPPGLAGVALLSIAFPMKVSEPLLEATRNDEARARDMINYWSHSGPTHRPGAPGPGFSLFLGNWRLMERQPAGVLYNDFNACNAYGRGLERVSALKCPVLYLLAQRDAMTMTRNARELIRATPHAEVVEIPGSGHNMMAEQPDATLRGLMQWLARLR